MGKVPCEPESSPTFSSLARNVPLDTVICWHAAVIWPPFRTMTVPAMRNPPSADESIHSEALSTSRRPPESSLIPFKISSAVGLPAVFSSRLFVTPPGADTVRLLMIIVLVKLLTVLEETVTVLLELLLITISE